jgi:hypothetical protein
MSLQVPLKDSHGAKVNDSSDVSTVKYWVLQQLLQVSRQVIMRFMLMRSIAASIEDTVLVAIDFPRWQDCFVITVIWIPAQPVNEKGRVKTTWCDAFSLVAISMLICRHHDRTSDNSRSTLSKRAPSTTGIAVIVDEALGTKSHACGDDMLRTRFHMPAANRLFGPLPRGTHSLFCLLLLRFLALPFFLTTTSTPPWQTAPPPPSSCRKAHQKVNHPLPSVATAVAVEMAMAVAMAASNRSRAHQSPNLTCRHRAPRTRQATHSGIISTRGPRRDMALTCTQR